ncbi:MAG: hypothetical protein ACFFDT_10530 [Candidatus Hodarchaeota archaeon]
MKGHNRSEIDKQRAILDSALQDQKTTPNELLLEYYKLLMLLISYDTLKKLILVILAHIYPREVSVAQLAALCNYSKQGNAIYRKKPLAALEKEKYITITRVNSKRYKIQLNTDNELMCLLVHLCQNYGFSLRDHLIYNLDEKRVRMIVDEEESEDSEVFNQREMKEKMLLHFFLRQKLF